MLNRNLCARLAFCIVALGFLAVIASHAQQANSGPTLVQTAGMNSFRATSFQISEAPVPPRVVDKKFVLVSALVMGLTISDLERTQHCLHRGTCIEMNPMLPHSRAGMYAVNIPLNAATMWLGYRMKSQGRKTWWIAPALVAAGHGIGTAFRF